MRKEAELKRRMGRKDKMEYKKGKIKRDKNREEEGEKLNQRKE